MGARALKGTYMEMETKNMGPEVEKKTNPQESSSSSEVKVDENEPSHIDFSRLSALANPSEEKEKWYKSLGNSTIETLLSIGLFIISILWDVVKSLWLVIKTIGLFFYKAPVAIGRFFRKLHRIWRESDGAVRASFFICGFGSFKRKQIGNGLIFLAVQVVFVLFMVLSGGLNLFNLIFLGEKAQGDFFGDPTLELPNYTSINSLILGLLTILFICAYLFVWYSNIKSAYDAYVIVHQYDFLGAKQDALYFIQHLDEFPEAYSEAEDGNGKAKLVFLKPSALKKCMRETYGFSHLSALYISYIRPDRVNIRPESKFATWRRTVAYNWYRHYDAFRQKKLNGSYSSVYAKHLTWEWREKPSKCGFPIVESELTAAINSHRHTFDKYNRYNPIVRDNLAQLEILDRPELLQDAIFQLDPRSVSNGLQPIPLDEPKLNAKVIASRVVGAFECAWAPALFASKCYLEARKVASTTGRDVLEVLAEKTALLHEKHDSFVEKYSVDGVASARGIGTAYEDYDLLRASFDQGKNVFITEAMSAHHLSVEDAKRVYEDYSFALRATKDDPEGTKRLLHKMGERRKTVVALYESTPLYGQPIHFSKKCKQFLDEKFAVTVLTLPVLGAIITSILPLLFSIVIAFTNMNNNGSTQFNGTLGIFDWSLQSFEFFTGSSKTNLFPTFMYVLGWTLTWAFFATFLNYIFGIVLALLINNKHIRLKKMWRTFFVISIAIPQFITLLAMSKIFGNGGPINTWLYTHGYVDSLENFWLMDNSNNSFMPKLLLILINCWIGVPYTMLSTTGILMNIPEDLYESAKIDGASPWKQFWKITMPYILFVTGPSLLTTFIGNINNFNVIFFLTGGGPSSSLGKSPVMLQAKAQTTDLLITWLYKLTINNPDTPQYGTGSVIGILIFVVCAFFSLIVYKRLGSTQNEEAFQ